MDFLKDDIRWPYRPHGWRGRGQICVSPYSGCRLGEKSLGLVPGPDLLRNLFFELLPGGIMNQDVQFS